jgi:2-iminobutanoate/2-iminopropanoate deaminase
MVIKIKRYYMQLTNSPLAPKAIGPYSQAVVLPEQGMVYTSGQIPVTKDGIIVAEDFEGQALQVLKNLKIVLEASGSSMYKVVKTNIYLAHMNDFEKLNDIYEEFFKGHKPARATIAAQTLPKNVLIEMDAVALL